MRSLPICISLVPLPGLIITVWSLLAEEDTVLQISKFQSLFLQNEHGTIEHTKTGHKSDHIHFEGTGKVTGKNGTDPIRIEARITIDEIKLTVKN